MYRSVQRDVSWIHYASDWFPRWHVMLNFDFLHSTLEIIPSLCNSLRFRKRQRPNVARLSVHRHDLCNSHAGFHRALDSWIQCSIQPAFSAPFLSKFVVFSNIKDTKCSAYESTVSWVLHEVVMNIFMTSHIFESIFIYGQLCIINDSVSGKRVSFSTKSAMCLDPSGQRIISFMLAPGTVS